MMQLICGGVGVMVPMRLHLFHDLWQADCNEVTAFVAVEGIFVHVAMPRVECIVCEPSILSATNFRGHTMNVEQ